MLYPSIAGLTSERTDIEGVEVRRVPVTISHAACDLTGVAVSYRNRGGATVPRNGGGTGIGNSDGFELTVHPGSLDVTITVTGPPGNM
jgi:hypothetical protein